MERRGFLRWAVGSAVAVGIALAAVNFTSYLQRSTLITVKAVYFQMSQYVNISDEYFVLQDPASIRDLANAIVLKHPSLSTPMIASMLILVNGVPATGLDFTLKDKDEVDLVPLVAGG